MFSHYLVIYMRLCWGDAVGDKLYSKHENPGSVLRTHIGKPNRVALTSISQGAGILVKDWKGRGVRTVRWILKERFPDTAGQLLT